MSKIIARLNVITDNGICTTVYDEYDNKGLKSLQSSCILAANGGLDYMELTDASGTIIIIPKNVLMNSVFTIEQKQHD